MKYILRYTGNGKPDADKLKQILNDNNIKILDGSSLPKMLLVDGMKENFISRINQVQKGWEAFPQKNSYNVPDTRRKVIK